MSHCIFLKQEEKHITNVGFSKSELKYHTGVAGLKYYLIIMYLRKHLQSYGEISTTLTILLDDCGYSTNSHNKLVYQHFRDIIQTEIVDKGFGTCSVDIKTVSPSAIFTIQLSEDKSIFYSSSNFVQLSVKDFEIIVNSKGGTVNKAILVGVYLFIKQYIISSEDNQQYFPQISHPSKNQIKKGIGISSLTTIEKAIDELEELKLIYVGRGMYIEDFNNPDTFIPTRNVYGLSKGAVSSNVCLQELEKLYGRTVYLEKDIQDKITFIAKQKG